MRLDRDSKQPILLGLILIFTAFIFTLFFITSVLADDEFSEPPHDPQYNNLVFITVSDKMYIGGDTVIDMYSGASDGANAITWKNNFSSNLSGFFQFVPIEQCFFIIASDGANAGFLNSIREVLSDLGASYWSGEQDGYWNPDHDLSGYEDQRAPFGIHNVRYMSRIVKYLPASPTPSPGPLEEEYFFLNLTDYGIVCFTFSCTNFNEPVEQLLQDNNMLSGIMNDFNTGNIFENGPIFIKRKVGKGASLYFSGSNVNIGNWYFIGDSIVNNDIEYIKQNYTPHSGSPIQLYNYTLYESSGSVVGLNCIYFVYGFSGSAYDTSFVNGGSFNVISLTENVDFPYAFTVNSYQDNRPMYFVYKYGLNSEDNVNPNPSPSPTAAPPTPTEAPHVIINWPSGTPSPTPPFSVPAEDLGGGSGSAGGSSQGSLTPGQVNSTLYTFKQYTQNNGAFAFLYACTSLIPDDALFFLFILLFILLLLACLRLFVHFTGG